MNLKRHLGALAMLALSGCAAPQPEGKDPFRDAVAAEYEALYQKELALTDWYDWPRFRRLRDAALRGEAPEPDDLSARKLSPEARAALEPARDRLIRVLLSPAQVVAGKDVAAALGGYECWAEEAEEGLARDAPLLDACRTRFETAIIRAEEAANTPLTALLPAEEGGAVVVTGRDGASALLDAPFKTAISGANGLKTAQADPTALNRVMSRALAAESRAPRSYLIYFKTGGTDITEESAAALEAAVADAADTEAARVSVFGHTDTVGPAGVNARVSSKRAIAMKELLITHGIPVEAITAQGFGESDLLVATPDSIDEPRNRRVEIVVR